MWSGKTTKLILEYQKWRCLNKPVLVINHASDNRYGDDEYLYSHDCLKIPCILANQLSNIPEKLITDAEAIFVNESQFFDDLKDKCLEWCEKYAKHIYLAGLDGDRNRQKFGQLLDLIPYSDHYEKLQAKCLLCADGTPAIFTYDRDSHPDAQIRIGNDQYLPLCRQHYLSMPQSHEKKA